MDDKTKYECTHRPYLHYIIRPIGRKFIPLAIRFGLVPNQITFFSTIALFASMILFGIGGYCYQLLAVGIFQIREILDTIDGDLARQTGQSSRKGEYLDAIGGYLLGGLLLPSIGLGLTRTLGLSCAALSHMMHIAPWAYLSVGLWAGLIGLMTRLISLRHRFLFSESLHKSNGKISRAASCFEDFLPFLLIMAVIVKSLDIILLLFALFYSVRFLYVLYASFKK